MNFAVENRPDNLDDYWGNEKTKKIITKMAEAETRPTTYLFHGPHGSGKTTLARIFSKMVNCPEDNIFEINAGLDKGIGAVRDMTDSVAVPTFAGAKKVYILDEAHNFTTQAEEGLLKLLEEPPKDVYFVLCSTNPQKIVKTVISRCTKFEIERLQVKELTKCLFSFAEKNNIQVTKKICKAIVKRVNRHNRDAIILLEKLSHLESEDEQQAMIDQVIIELDEKEAIDLCRILLTGGWKDVAEVLAAIPDTANVETIRLTICGYMQKVLLYGEKNTRAANVLNACKNDFFRSGFSGLVHACYQAVNAK